MAVEFKVSLENRPGTLAHLGHVLGKAGVNLDAFQLMSVGSKSLVQFVADNSEHAAAALDEAGIAYARRDVLITNILDQPGTLGDVALVMADAGINIDSVYVTARGAVVMGVDDLAGAMQVAGGMAVRVY